MEKNRKSGTRPKPIYLNRRVWLIISSGLALIALIALLIVGPEAVNGILALITAWVTGSGVWGVFVKYIWPFIQKALEDSREARKEAKEANEKTDTNTEDISFLRVGYAAISKSYEAMSRSYEALSKRSENLADDLERERDRFEAKTTQLEEKVQILSEKNQVLQTEIEQQKRAHQREIAELTEQIRLMGLEKSSDKAKIVQLESKVEQLQNRVRELEERERKLDAEKKRLQDESKRLQDENFELKSNFGRRYTDKLGPLSPEAEARLNHLDVEEKVKEKANE